MVNNTCLDFCNGQRGRAWAWGGRHDPDLHRLPHRLHLRQHQQEGRTRWRCSWWGLSLHLLVPVCSLGAQTIATVVCLWSLSPSPGVFHCLHLFLCIFLCQVFCVPTHYLALYSAKIIVIQLYRIVTFWGERGRTTKIFIMLLRSCVLMEYTYVMVVPVDLMLEL